MKFIVGIADPNECQHPKIRVQLVKATRMAMDGEHPEMLYCPDCETHIAFATTVTGRDKKKLN